MMDLTRQWPLGLDRRNWPGYLTVLALVLFVTLFFDVYISQAVLAWPHVWREPFGFITDIGLSDWVLIPSGLAFLAVFPVYRWGTKTALWRRAAFDTTLVSGFIFLAVAVPGLFANLVKRLVGRGRPQVYDEVGAFHFQHVLNDWTFQSFPSGHSAAVAATAFCLGFLVPRFFPLFLVVALAVGVSRVVVGAHYPSDVIAGLAIGMLGAYGVRKVFARRRWLFAPTPAGGVRFRGLPGLRRLLQRAAR